LQKKADGKKKKMGTKRDLFEAFGFVDHLPAVLGPKVLKSQGPSIFAT
jgi:hypothetical protein